MVSRRDRRAYVRAAARLGRRFVTDATRSSPRRPDRARRSPHFYGAIDDLVREGLAQPLARRSPGRLRLAAQGAERRHPQEPRGAATWHSASWPTRSASNAPRITAAVRTGDTTSSERAAMLRTPPHILVTTPESLYLLLTSARSREMLRTVRDGDRRRNSRGDRHAPRRAPRAVASSKAAKAALA